MNHLENPSRTAQSKLETAIVTGAGKGLGRALARELARAGVRVVLVARTESDVQSAAREIAGEGGIAHPLAFDVSEKEAIHRIAAAAAALVGPIDILVHAASTLGKVPMPLLLDTECEDFAKVLETNLIGPFRLTKAIAGSMALRGKGVVAFISSDAAVSAYEGWGAYGVSKAADDHLARSFAAELGALGVTSFAFDPGEMDTEMHSDALPDADKATLERPERVAVQLARLILGPDSAASGARLIYSKDAPQSAASVQSLEVSS